MKSFKDYEKIVNEIAEMDCDETCINFKEISAFDHIISQKFINSLKDAGNKEWFEIDILLAKYANEYLTAGFINGFIRAMYLMYKAAETQEEAKAV